MNCLAPSPPACQCRCQCRLSSPSPSPSPSPATKSVSLYSFVRNIHQNWFGIDRNKNSLKSSSMKGSYLISEYRVVLDLQRIFQEDPYSPNIRTKSSPKMKRRPVRGKSPLTALERCLTMSGETLSRVRAVTLPPSTPARTPSPPPTSSHTTTSVCTCPSV